MIPKKILGLTSFLILTTTFIAPVQNTKAQTAPALTGAMQDARIEWQSSTRQLIQAGGLYGRVARVDEKSVACIYERAGGVHLKISDDNGKSWGEEIGVAQYEHGNAANPELLIFAQRRLAVQLQSTPTQRTRRGSAAVCDCDLSQQR